jgi:hypothetical protein
MNYLYFNTADNDSVLYPASAFRGADQSAGTTIDLYFTPLVNLGKNSADDVCDKIALTITDGKEKEVLKAIAALVNAPLAADAGFVVVGDDTNGVYIENVTAVGAITIAS